MIFFSVTNTVALKCIHIEKKQSIKNFSIWPKNSPKTLSLYPWLTKWTSRLLANAAPNILFWIGPYFAFQGNGLVRVLDCMNTSATHASQMQLCTLSEYSKTSTPWKHNNTYTTSRGTPHEVQMSWHTNCPIFLTAEDMYDAPSRNIENGLLLIQLRK